MQTMIERIRNRLAQNAYANEAAISHGVVTPILNALGWDSSDPDQLVPEYTIERGRVDFALFGLGHRPAVFIEVKGVGRAVEGDRQLFEYAFHQGVPICVLTDGRDWSFYLPAAQGSYDDRRVYRLQLDDRTPEESERILRRYLLRERVRDHSAFEDAQRDYRDAASRREAATAVPRAWLDLVAEPDELLVQLVSERVEARCGFKPERSDIVGYVRSLTPRAALSIATASRKPAVPPAPPPVPAAVNPAPADDIRETSPSQAATGVTFKLLGRSYNVANASMALVEILRVLAARDPGRIAALAAAVKGRTRSLIAPSPAEINPARPDLARAAEFSPGWLVGLNTSNREKAAIIAKACDIWGVRVPDDLDLELPNAG